MEFAADAVSDPILVRSSGMPVYNYVVTIDDALDEDHSRDSRRRSSLKHAETGRDLSGVRLAGAAVRASLHDSGAGQNAVIETPWRNFHLDLSRDGCAAGSADKLSCIARLGCGGGTRETFTMSELAAEFTLERVTPSPAIFDFNKLHWLNRHYLKLAEPARVLQLARPYFVAKIGCRTQRHLK